MGKQCNCKTKFFKENNHWSLTNFSFYEKSPPPEYSLRWLGFKNNLRMTSINYRTESKKDFIIS
jgi:hypothetical protein